MISITLHPRGMKPRTYQDDIRMRESMEAFELAKRWEDAAGNYTPEILQEDAAFIARCFGRQFTEEELLDGYRGSLYVLVPNFLRAVIGYVAEEITNFPPKAAKATDRA